MSAPTTPDGADPAPGPGDWPAWTPTAAEELGRRLAEDGALWWAAVRALEISPPGEGAARLEAWLRDLGVAGPTRAILTTSELSPMARVTRLTAHLRPRPAAHALGRPMDAAAVTVLAHRALAELAMAAPEPQTTPAWWALHTLDRGRAFAELGALPGGRGLAMLHDTWPGLCAEYGRLTGAGELPVALAGGPRRRARDRTRLLLALLNTTAEATTLRFEADRLRRSRPQSPPWLTELASTPRPAGIEGLPLDLALVNGDAAMRGAAPTAGVAPPTRATTRAHPGEADGARVVDARSPWWHGRRGVAMAALMLAMVAGVALRWAGVGVGSAGGWWIAAGTVATVGMAALGAAVVVRLGQRRRRLRRGTRGGDRH